METNDTNGCLKADTLLIRNICSRCNGSFRMRVFIKYDKGKVVEGIFVRREYEYKRV